MNRSNPWDAPPKTASWRRLITLVVPLVAATACDQTEPVGLPAPPTDRSSGTDTSTTVVDTADTGAE